MELLVVIAIIGILIALLLPAVQAAREAARRTQCANNLKQIGLAVHTFHNSTSHVPPSFTSGLGHATWLVLIMPYLELGDLYDLRDPEMMYYGHPDEVLHMQVSFYLCPSHRTPPQLSKPFTKYGLTKQGAVSDYVICGGDGTYWYHYEGGVDKSNGIGYPAQDPPGTLSGSLIGSPPNQRYTGYKMFRRIRDVSDGLSHTLLVGEKNVHPDHEGDIVWGDETYFNDDTSAASARVVGRTASGTYPLAPSPGDPSLLDDPVLNSAVFGSYHPRGMCQFVLCDGSVQAFSPDMDITIMGYLANMRDGQQIPADFGK